MHLIHLLAQAAVAAAPVEAASARQGVTSYTPDYFAAQQPSTAVDMLSRIPGFNLDNGASVRGFEGAAGNVLIDGQRPASKSDSLQDILFRIPASKVERIDIIRGGAPGIDMQGKTVLANVIRKKDSGVRGVLAVADNHMDDGRDLGQVRLEGSGALGQVKWELSGRNYRGLDDGMGAGKGVRFAQGAPTVATGYDGEGDGLAYNGVGAVEAPLLGGQIRLNGRLLTDDFKAEEFTRVFTAPVTTEQSVFKQDQDETELGGRYTRKFGEPWDLELVGLRTTRDRLVTNFFTDSAASLFTVDRDTVETIGRAVVKYRVNPKVSLELGGETAINTLDSATRLGVDGVAVILPAANVEVEEDRTEVFAKATWRPVEHWTVDLGLRYETSTISSDGDVVLEKTLNYLKPRLAVSWAPRESTQLRMRLEREVDQLNFGDFVASGGLNSAGGVTAGNPDLDPGQDWVGEIAWEQRFWKAGSVVLTYRHFELSDVVDRGPVTSGTTTFDRPENIGDGTRDVIVADLSLPFDRLGMKGALLKGNLTKRWSRVTDPTTGEKRVQSGLRRLEWNASFTYDMPQYKITWGADVFGGFRESYYRFNLVEQFKLNPYVKPFIEYKPRPDLNIRLELPNLTRRNLHDVFYIYPGLRTAAAQAPSSIDDKRTNQTPGGTFFRVRKTFG
jgi:outer membrane receptor protein involved in Fe transport